MPQDESLTLIWKALSDPTRRSLLDLLRARPHTTGELCAEFPQLSRFAVMKHLAVLEEAHLVFVRPQGRERWNHLNVVPLQQIYERWLRPYEAQWATNLLQLKTHVEQTKGTSTMATQTAPSVNLHSMNVEQEVTIQADPEKVFGALTHDIAAWWGAPYLMTQAPKTIQLEPQVGGRFYEVSQDGGGCLWATVTAIQAPQHLELTGPIGMSGALHSVVSIQLEAQGDATIVKLAHRAIGEISEDAPANYTAGWQDLFGTRLKAFVETGQRMGIG